MAPIRTYIENALPPKSKLAKATKGYIYKVQTKKKQILINKKKLLSYKVLLNEDNYAHNFNQLYFVIKLFVYLIRVVDFGGSAFSKSVWVGGSCIQLLLASLLRK